MDASAQQVRLDKLLHELDLVDTRLEKKASEFDQGFFA
jgi:hypothetical protein